MLTPLQSLRMRGKYRKHYSLGNMLSFFLPWEAVGSKPLKLFFFPSTFAHAHSDADFIFSTLMEYEKACMLSSPSGSAAAGSGDVSKAQATFLSTVVTKFTPESFHTLRKYLMVTMSDIKSVTNLLLRAQKFTDAGAAMALRALSENDLREKQGILSVRYLQIVSHCAVYGSFFLCSPCFWKK